MRCKRLVLLTLVLTAPVFATVDPDENQFGFYFDLNANSIVHDATPGLPFMIYLVLTNPTFAEFSGFEVGYTVSYPVEYADQFFIVGESFEGLPACPSTEPPGTYSVLYSTPRPTAPATILVSWQVMLISEFEVSLYLHDPGATCFDDGRPVVLINEETYPVGITRIQPGTGCPCEGGVCASALINSPCDAVADERFSWGGIKSLYRD